MNKGFTLVELLAILTILGIITLVSVPSIVVTNKKSQENNYMQYKKTVENAAEVYVETHPEEFQEVKTIAGTTVNIKTEDLIIAGFIHGTLQNPKTKTKISEEASSVNVKNESGTLKYTYVEA